MLVITSDENSAISDRSTVVRGDDNIVDIETLDGVGLSELLANRAIEAPENWDDLSTDGRKAWLKSKFEASTYSTVETPMTKANARSRSKVSLMTSLAALANPIEGTFFGDAPAHRRNLPTVGVGSSLEWEPNNSKGAVPEIIDATRRDPLHHLVHEIEGLDETDALGLVAKLANQAEVTFFRLGGVLARLQASGGHKAYGSFKIRRS